MGYWAIDLTCFSLSVFECGWYWETTGEL